MRLLTQAGETITVDQDETDDDDDLLPFFPLVAANSANLSGLEHDNDFRAGCAVVKGSQVVYL